MHLLNNAPKNIQEMLVQAGISDPKIRNQINRNLQRMNIQEFSQLIDWSILDFTNEARIKSYHATLILQYLTRLRRGGDLVISGKDMLEQAKEKDRSTFQYIRTPSNSLNSILVHTNGKVGFRSGTLIEIFGTHGTGKTQLLMTLSAMVIRNQSVGGWRKNVAWIDGNQNMDIHRLLQVMKYWQLSGNHLDRVLVSSVNDLEDLDKAINTIAAKIIEDNIGMVVIDSLLTPLHQSHPIDKEDQMVKMFRRQDHLRYIIHRLKTIARIYNVLIIYTNGVRPRANGTTLIKDVDHDDVIPLGGSVLSYGSDIRIHIEVSSVGRSINQLRSSVLRKATIVNCSYLPSRSAEFILTDRGITDVAENKSKRIAQTEPIAEIEAALQYQ